MKEQLDNHSFELGYKACEKHYKDLKSKMYTEEEVKSLCHRSYNYGFIGGLYEHSNTQSKEHDCNSFKVWFEQNKKK